MNVDLKELRRDWELAIAVHDKLLSLTKRLQETGSPDAAQYLEEKIRKPAAELADRLFSRLAGGSK